MAFWNRHKKNKEDEIDELLERAQQSEGEDTDDQNEPYEEEDNEDDNKKKKGRRRLLNELISDGESDATSLKDLWRGMEINGQWFKNNIWFIAIITLCLFAFVTNRYQAEQEVIEEARLQKELSEWKYIWLTRFSELTTSTRESQIEQRLRQAGDTLLRHSQESPYIIKVKK